MVHLLPLTAEAAPNLLKISESFFASGVAGRRGTTAAEIIRTMGGEGAGSCRRVFHSSVAFGTPVQVLTPGWPERAKAKALANSLINLCAVAPAAIGAGVIAFEGSIRVVFTNPAAIFANETFHAPPSIGSRSRFMVNSMLSD
jgi:hypothetical protein